MPSLPARAFEETGPDRRAILAALERKVLWLSAWTIHNANHLRPSRDGLKVGGHQASCSSIAAMMTALYFDVLRPEDRVAVKPHAAPSPIRPELMGSLFYDLHLLREPPR